MLTTGCRAPRIFSGRAGTSQEGKGWPLSLPGVAKLPCATSSTNTTIRPNVTLLAFLGFPLSDFTSFHVGVLPLKFLSYQGSPSQQSFPSPYFSPYLSTDSLAALCHSSPSSLSQSYAVGLGLEHSSESPGRALRIRERRL